MKEFVEKIMTRIDAFLDATLPILLLAICFLAIVDLVLVFIKMVV